MDNYSRIGAHLVIVEQGGVVRPTVIYEDQYIIGKTGGANDIAINSPIVSSQHGIISYSDGYFYYNDLASTNGTFINGEFIQGFSNTPSKAVMLNDGDVLIIGQNDDDRVYIFFDRSSGSNMSWNLYPLSGNNEITIGRGRDNSIVIPSITISRRHAVINNSGGNVTISDAKSSNGTIVNGVQITSNQPFVDGSVARLSSSKIIRTGQYLLYGIPAAAKISNEISYKNNIESKQLTVSNIDKYEFARESGVRVEIQNISRLVKCKNGTGIDGGNKKYILKDVSLNIEPGELVAILGGSGAGKTTFMNCVNGFEPATEGRVLINGVDLYNNYQTVKSSMGYVPQQDIVHDALTLEDMLTYSGKLRLPPDVTAQEISQRVAEVLDMVDLTPQKDTLIKKLSGGQRKRASIAVELVSDPTLFFLDEPTSGLDPEAETNLMHQLKGLSQGKGKTVIVITHTLQNIDVFDKVIFLAPGGRLCFYGSVNDARNFFGVSNLIDAYEKISDDIDGYIAKFEKMRGGSRK